MHRGLQDPPHTKKTWNGRVQKELEERTGSDVGEGHDIGDVVENRPNEEQGGGHPLHPIRYKWGFKRDPK
jgi:hypothetical protein